MRYAVWSRGPTVDDPDSPKLVTTNGRLFVGDRLASGWVTEVVQGVWTDDQGDIYDGRARISGKKPRAHRS